MDKKMWFRSRYKPWHIDSCVSTMWIRMKMVHSPVTGGLQQVAELGLMKHQLTQSLSKRPLGLNRRLIWSAGLQPEAWLAKRKSGPISFHAVNLPLEVTIIHSYTGLHWECNGYDFISMRVTLKQLMDMPQDTLAWHHQPSCLVPYTMADDGWWCHHITLLLLI